MKLIYIKKFYFIIYIMNNHFNYICVVLLLVITTFIIYYRLEKFDNKKPAKVILFYTEWCKYSQKMLPVWEDVIKGIKNSNSYNLTFEKYDCDKNQEKCKEFEIDYLPTIYFVNGKEKTKYTDEIDSGQLGLFLMNQLESM